MVSLLSSLVLAFLIGLVALASAIGPPYGHLHAVVHGIHTAPPRHGPRLRQDTHRAPAATKCLDPREDSLRRLFGLSDVWSWVSGKKKNELLQLAKDKLTAKHQQVAQEENRHSQPPRAHRRLPPSPGTPPEMGTMFHTLRFFANRIGAVNDDAFTEQERLAALGSGSSSGSSSMDAEAKQVAAAKAAQAYGLTPPPLPETTTPSPPPVAAPTPTATSKSLLAGMEW